MSFYGSLIDEDLSLSGEKIPEPDEGFYGNLMDNADSERQFSLESSVKQGFGKDPDAYSKVKKIAQEADLPITVVEANKEEIEQGLKYKFVDPATMLEVTPQTAEFLLDPTNAAISQDDLPNLYKLEKWFDKSFQGIGETNRLMVENQARAAGAQTIDLLGPRKIRDLAPPIPFGVMMTGSELSLMADEMAEVLDVKTDKQVQALTKEAFHDQVTAIATNEKRIQKLSPQDLSIVQEGMRGAVTSLMQMAPGTIGTVLTRNPNFLLSTITAQSYLSGYGEGLAGGLTADQATRYGAINATIEWATEVLPTRALGDMLGGKGMKNALQRFVKGEVVGEQVATSLQTVNAIGHGLDEAMQDAETTAERIEIQLRRQAVTAVATVIAGGAQAGVFGGIGRLAQEAGQKSQTEQERLDEIHEIGDQSTTKARDKETFREHLFQLNETYGDENIFIPAEGLQAILQEEQIEDNKTLNSMVDQIQKAENVVGGEIVIPVSDYVTDIAGTPLGERLREVVRLSADSLSIKEAAEIDPNDPLKILDAVEKANKKAEAKAQTDAVLENITDQLIQTERLGTRQAKANAKIVSAYVTTKAERTGREISEVFNDMGVVVKGDSVPVKPKQIWEQGQDLTGISLSETLTIAETGEQVIIKQNPQELWDNQQDRRNRLRQLIDCING